MSEDLSASDADLIVAAVAAALSLEYERLAQIDLQATAGVDEGNIARQIRNISERINRISSIVKFAPFKVKGKEKVAIEEKKLEKFNEYVEDFFILEELIRDIFNPDKASMDLYETYEQVFVQKYESQVNDLLEKEVKNKTWKDIQHSYIYLRKFLLQKIMRLGYELQGQGAIALIQTLPREEVENLTRQLRQRRSNIEWQQT